MHTQLQIKGVTDNFFSYFSNKYVVGTHQKCLSKALKLSTYNMFSWEIRKNTDYVLVKKKKKKKKKKGLI